VRHGERTAGIERLREIIKKERQGERDRKRETVRERKKESDRGIVNKERDREKKKEIDTKRETGRKRKRVRQGYSK
jgi:hypothetical protein